VPLVSYIYRVDVHCSEFFHQSIQYFKLFTPFYNNSHPPFHRLLLQIHLSTSKSTADTKDHQIIYLNLPKMQFTKSFVLSIFLLGATAVADINARDEIVARDQLKVRDALQEAHEIAMRSDPDVFRREVRLPNALRSE
jgi:hypothetical protein